MDLIVRFKVFSCVAGSYLLKWPNYILHPHWVVCGYTNFHISIRRLERILDAETSLLTCDPADKGTSARVSCLARLTSLLQQKNDTAHLPQLGFLEALFYYQNN